MITIYFHKSARWLESTRQLVLVLWNLETQLDYSNTWDWYGLGLVWWRTGWTSLSSCNHSFPPCGISTWSPHPGDLRIAWLLIRLLRTWRASVSRSLCGRVLMIWPVKPTSSVIPHCIGQANHYAQHRFKWKEIRLYLSMGEMTMNLWPSLIYYIILKYFLWLLAPLLLFAILLFCYAYRWRPLFLCASIFFLSGFVSPTF